MYRLNTLDTSLLNTGIDDYSFSFDDLFQFLDSIKSDFNNVETNFQNVKEIFKSDKSFVLSSTANCSYNVSLMGITQEIDLCKYVSPYKSILSLYFTFIGMISIFIFSLKYLISRGGE